MLRACCDPCRVQHLTSEALLPGCSYTSLKIKKQPVAEGPRTLNYLRVCFPACMHAKKTPTCLYFDKLFYSHFLIKDIYFVIVRTKRMKCQNKREQLSEQVYISSRTTNVVSKQMKIRVRHMLLL
jgi:hypothetical protein